jgi:class 3 adenylate cyclase/tetratricopeptide (TPR) repeat protein
VLVCPSCGQENPDGFRLCGMCGASLAPEQAAAREERKVVTVLFCDLVGFTAKVEQLDPEDVRAVLAPYHARVRDELEHYGGTVEKFIGDAVMALFGAPVAHEDDPERAVRAALAIRDFAVDDGLELRVGITTGEALVSLDASPAGGEGMASGDVVNTAARLQSAAPVNGALVDETTYRATRHIVDYADSAAVEAKGKSEPVSVWQAVQVRARPGVDVAHEARSDLVGREEELGVLRDALRRARNSRTSQLVTLVGVPGIGKSRLVHELRQLVIDDPDLIAWRQGRCLAYGDGVTLWALGEIVKAQAGIHEQDSPAEAAAKVGSATDEALAGSTDLSWVKSNVLALVGLGSESELGGDRRNEAFSAWRRFFEAMAEQRPLVLVFEDLHWADDALLDFVDELVEWVTDVPLLVVGTARPELLERRPGWGGGKLNATTLALQPLSDDDTARLLAGLLASPVLLAESQQTLLERAGGNPLYAEQFVELYRERGGSDDLPLPETLQGIIAARLDGLPQGEKELLRDAAVVGKVFWPSALASRPPDEVTQTLHSLERKGFVRRQRRTSVEGESELAFAHALVRDVAYAQIARADRAEKHRRTGDWIDSLGRPDDHAELLAHHWKSALELTRAAGADDVELAERTRRALRDAGDRAFVLNSFAAAAARYQEALALSPSDAPGRAELLFRRAHALHVIGDDEQITALLGARDALLEIGDEQTAAQAEAFLSRAEWYRGHGEEARRHIDHAQELVANAGPTAAKARVLCLLARLRMLSSDPEEAIRIGEEALALAESNDLDELRIHALTTLGSAKTMLDHTGDAELDRALELSEAINSPLGGIVLNNRAALAAQLGDMDRAEELLLATLDLAEQFGERENVRFTRGNLLYHSVRRGRWDEAMADADLFIAECEASPHNMETAAREMRAVVRFGRGDVEGAIADWERVIALGREMGAPERLLTGLLGLARGLFFLGREHDSRELIAEALELAEANPTVSRFLGIIAGQAWRLGLGPRVVEIATADTAGPWKDAAVAEAGGEPERAADLYHGMGMPAIEAHVRFNAGEAYLEQGRTAEGLAELEKALAFFRSVQATFFVERGEALLARAESA